ncbi:DUF4214 domain-containing protein [Reyranella sp.]|uniref:DUF4214 domain-containing protein n=1 Tax=Reyranella sp. TaxID=1929291 RepID=UPI003D151CD8
MTGSSAGVGLFRFEWNDNLRVGGGNDTLDGGAGSDEVTYLQASKHFTVSVAGESVIVQDRSGVEGTDTLLSVNQILFGDGGAFDPTWLVKATQLDQARFVDLFEMYAAYLNRAPDALGVDYWASRLVDGMTLQQIAKSFFVQPETMEAYLFHGREWAPLSFDIALDTREP